MRRERNTVEMREKTVEMRGKYGRDEGIIRLKMRGKYNRNNGKIR